MCCNNGGVVWSDRLFRSASTCKSENKRKRCWPAVRQKNFPASSTWWHFFEVQVHLSLIALPNAPPLSPGLLVWIRAITLDVVGRDGQDPPLQLLLSDNVSTFFNHISEPLCAPRLKRMTAILVEKSTTPFPTHYSLRQCCHTMPWNDSWAFWVAPIRPFCRSDFSPNIDRFDNLKYALR